jgi:dihydroneopterin aldolase
VLFGDRISTAVLALMGDAGIVAHAVQTDFQVGAALVARFASSRLAGKSEFPAAFVAMTGHGANLTLALHGEKFGLCAARRPSYPVEVDTIVIKDLGVLCRIGVPDEERAKPQRLLITVEMGDDFSRAGASDDIQHTINYFDVSRRVIALCQEQPYRLLEKLAEDVARMVLNEYGAKTAGVEVKKFILSDARYVSVRINRSR